MVFFRSFEFNPLSLLQPLFLVPRDHPADQEVFTFFLPQFYISFTLPGAWPPPVSNGPVLATPPVLTVKELSVVGFLSPLKSFSVNWHPLFFRRHFYLAPRTPSHFPQFLGFAPRFLVLLLGLGSVGCAVFGHPSEFWTFHPFCGPPSYSLPVGRCPFLVFTPAV